MICGRIVENANAPGIKIPQSILVRTESVIDKDLNVRNGAYRLAGTGRERQFIFCGSGRSNPNR